MAQDFQRRKLNREIALLNQIITALEKYQGLAHGLDASVDLDRYREFLQETIAEREALSNLVSIYKGGL